jgi:phospholipid-transporting ATPase
VFARAEPVMKQTMVAQMKERNPDAITLAIGDGANDVQMIQCAHVGVGIAGIEGTAAAQSADYAIGTFRMVHTLLFVHGFWSYQRMSTLVNVIFYKACLVAVSMYFFGFFSGFSGTQYFPDAPYQLYNVVYTALPVICVAVVDRSLPKNLLENTPEAYAQAKHQYFNGPVFFLWILRSFLHGIAVFFGPLLALGYNSVVHANGQTNGLTFMSSVAYYAVVLIPTFLIYFEMQSFTFFHALTIFLSLLAVFLINFIINVFGGLVPDMYGEVDSLYANPMAWLTIIWTMMVPLLVELSFRAFHRHLTPFYTHILQEWSFLASQPKGKDGSLIDVQKKPTSPQLSASPLLQARTDKVHGKLREFEEQAQKRDQGMSVTKNPEHIRNTVIPALLRTHQMTGSVFESAAQAKFQQHADFTSSDGQVQKGANATAQVHLVQEVESPRHGNNNGNNNTSSQTLDFIEVKSSS